MSIFNKINIKQTMTDLNNRRIELAEASEWFDGSDGEVELIKELNIISKVFQAFYDNNGVTAVDYYGLHNNHE